MGAAVVGNTLGGCAATRQAPREGLVPLHKAAWEGAGLVARGGSDGGCLSRVVGAEEDVIQAGEHLGGRGSK